MTATATVRSNQANRKVLSLSDIQTGKSDLPNRYVLYGPPGVGKTTLGASFPAPVFLQAAGETGLDALIKSGQLPDTLARFPESGTWDELTGRVKVLHDEDHGYKTLVIDTINGAEKLMLKSELETAYGGDQKKFVAYGAGERSAAFKMAFLLESIDRLRERRKMSVVFLCHSRIKEQHNPEGENYDRYEPDVGKETLATLLRWSDALLFMNFFIVVKDEKGRGGDQRVMQCDRRAAYEAKNRLGLPATIHLGTTKESAWSAFCEAMKNGKAGG